MPSVQSTSMRHTTLPNSPSGTTPSESLRTSTWGAKSLTCPSITSSGTSITSASGRLQGEGYRLAVHPWLHRNQHAHHLGSSRVGNRYVNAARKIDHG